MTFTVPLRAFFAFGKIEKIDIDQLANSQSSVYYNPAWGYTSRDQMYEEAKLHYKPSRAPKIPADFV